MPWWAPNRPRTHAQGGPDYFWQEYSKHDLVDTWRQVALQCKPYGLDGVQVSVNLPSPGAVPTVLEGARLAGNGFKAGIFVTLEKEKNVQDSIAAFNLFFDKLGENLNHPNLARCGKFPVICIYNKLFNFTPQQWLEILNGVEKKHGRMIWLFNACCVPVKDPKSCLSSYLSVFDGVTQYGAVSDFRTDKGNPLVETMREFPQKIFEGGVHNTYTVHFHFGGHFDPPLKRYFEAWEDFQQAKPDALNLTNFDDCYENSRFLPSYELDDSLMRVAQYKIELWRGKPVTLSDYPEIYVSNDIYALIGQKANFHLMAFPVKKQDSMLEVELEVCSPSGKVLHVFPKQQWKLDQLRTASFQLDTLPFAGEPALLPRLKYTWVNGKSKTTELLQPTMLTVGMRPHTLWWSRSLKRLMDVSPNPAEWTLNGKKPAETVIWQPEQPFIYKGEIKVKYGDLLSQRCSDLRLMRNFVEIDSYPAANFNFANIAQLPDPGYALDWYQIELENSKGARFETPPIFVSANRRPGQISMPVVTTSGEPAVIEIAAERVPFFHYACDADYGPYLYDSSGYQHHGFIGGQGYGGGHFERLGYRFEHLGKVAGDFSQRPHMPKFSVEPDGKGYFHFDAGKESFIMLMGGTAFAPACTYELQIKPDKFGQKQGLIASVNGQVLIELLADGRVRTARGNAVEMAGGVKAKTIKTIEVYSKQPLQIGKWTRLAVVYDLHDLILYVDGVEQGRAAVGYNPCWEVLNHVILGSNCKWIWDPVDYFTGGIRQVRIYGRNLSPDEFLK